MKPHFLFADMSPAALIEFVIATFADWDCALVETKLSLERGSFVG